MKNIIVLMILSLSFGGSTAFAETKVIKISKVHCTDCVTTLQEKICGSNEYAKCEVKQIDKKKKIGQLTIETKGDAKVDIKKINDILADSGDYKIIK